MPPQKRKYMDSVRNGNPAFKRSKPTAKDRRSRITTVVRAPGPIPPRAIVKMKYVEDISANGTTIDYVWNLNSVYDPNRTGTGHQPYARDTYATLYNRYRVFGVRYRITVNTGTVDRCVVLWNNDPNSFTNYTLAAETPTAITKTASSTNPCIFSGYLNLPKIAGQTPTQYRSEDRYQAAENSDPTETIVLHTVVSKPDGTADSAGNWAMQVQLTYYVEWFDMNQLGQS